MNFLMQLLAAWALITGVSILLQVLIFVGVIILSIILIKWIVKLAVKHPTISIILILALVFVGLVLAGIDPAALVISLVMFIDAIVSAILSFKKLKQSIK